VRVDLVEKQRLTFVGFLSHQSTFAADRVEFGSFGLMQCGTNLLCSEQ